MLSAVLIKELKGQLLAVSAVGHTHIRKFINSVNAIPPIIATIINGRGKRSCTVDYCTKFICKKNCLTLKFFVYCI
jgi:hypothetical protein